MKALKLVGCLLLVLLSTTRISAQTITLTERKNEILVNKVGTVTFSGSGITLEENAVRFGLRHLHGRTYNAAIFYEVAFSSGKVDSRGKIWNCTDNNITISCSFYSGNTLIATYKVVVKPRTFSRILPDGVPLSKVKHCDRIVCSESGISVGYTNKKNENQNGRSPISLSQNSLNHHNNKTTNSSSTLGYTNAHFSRATVFYGENSSTQFWDYYYPSGKYERKGRYKRGGSYLLLAKGTYYVEKDIIVTCEEQDGYTDYFEYALRGNYYRDGDVIMTLKK